VHIRQIALVASELEPLVSDLCAVFGLEVSFRDPGVAEFGLTNAVMPVGTQFLEVVSPFREGTTAARFLAKRGGDSGYMVILQTRDLAADRARLLELGVRLVWQIELDDVATVHLHPRDVGGAIVSIDQPVPAESWRWGGPGWQARARTDRVAAIRGVTLESRDARELAGRWSRALALGTPESAGGGFELELEGGCLRFLGTQGAEGIRAVELEATNPDAVLAEARARGLTAGEKSVTLGGVRFDLAPAG
jgi:hypothetical protein